MATATVVFRLPVQQEQQAVGTDRDMLSALLVADVTIGDKTYAAQTLRILQPQGTDFRVAPVEMQTSPGAFRRCDFQELADAAEDYYRTNVIGSATAPIQVDPRVTGIRFSGIQIRTPPRAYPVRVAEGDRNAW